MTEFYKGSIPCVVGISAYNITHEKLNNLLSFPFVSLTIPNISASPIGITGITNKTTTGFTVVLNTTPTISGYSLNWQVNVPGTDCKEYVNDKRYYSKEELGSAKLARVHYKNIISAPDVSPEALSQNHNHNTLYYTKQETVSIIQSEIDQTGKITPVADTLILRDASGRSQINSPKTGADISNKHYVDVKFSDAEAIFEEGFIYQQAQMASVTGSINTINSNLSTINTNISSITASISSNSFNGGTITNPIIVPNHPQAIVFGAPVLGSKALGIIDGKITISTYTGSEWAPLLVLG